MGDTLMTEAPTEHLRIGTFGPVTVWRADHRIRFFATRECNVLFSNPEFFGRVFVHLRADKEMYLGIKDANEGTDAMILHESETLFSKVGGDYPPIT